MANADITKKELLDALKGLVTYMNIAFEAEENPFGIHHNDATDALSVAEVIIAKAKKEKIDKKN